MLPLIKRMTEGMQRKDYIYFLILGIVFKGALNVFGTLTGLGDLGIECSIVTDAIFYPVMGYFFGTIIRDDECKLKKRVIVLLVVALLCILLSMGMVYWERAMNGGYTENYLSSLIVLPTVMTFYLVRWFGINVNIPYKVKRLIEYCGELSFGVYLFSIYFQWGIMLSLREKLIEKMPSWPLTATWIYIVAVWIIGMLVTTVLKWVVYLFKCIWVKIKVIFTKL